MDIGYTGLDIQGWIYRVGYIGLDIGYTGLDIYRVGYIWLDI